MNIEMELIKYGIMVYIISMIALFFAARTVRYMDKNNKRNKA